MPQMEDSLLHTGCMFLFHVTKPCTHLKLIIQRIRKASAESIHFRLHDNEEYCMIQDSMVQCMWVVIKALAVPIFFAVHTSKCLVISCWYRLALRFVNT